MGGDPVTNTTGGKYNIAALHGACQALPVEVLRMQNEKPERDREKEGGGEERLKGREKLTVCK